MNNRERTGRTIRIEARQSGHSVGIILAPYGVIDGDPGYEEEGGDPAELIDADGTSVAEKIQLLNEQLDEALVRGQNGDALRESPPARQRNGGRELVGYVTTEFDCLLIADPVAAERALDAWGMNERYVGQLLAIHDEEGDLACGAVIAPTQLPYWKFAVYTIRGDQGVVEKLEIEPVAIA
jgi:hypothetical protein